MTYSLKAETQERVHNHSLDFTSFLTDMGQGTHGRKSPGIFPASLCRNPKILRKTFSKHPSYPRQKVRPLRVYSLKPQNCCLDIGTYSLIICQNFDTDTRYIRSKHRSMVPKQEVTNGSETEKIGTDKTEITTGDTDTEKEDSPYRTDTGDSTEGEESIESRLESTEKAAEESYDRFLRVSADFENFKRRSARELADFRKYANETLIRQLLPVVDNLERAIASTVAKDDGKSFVEGVGLTLKEILKVFEKFVVRPIDAIGKPFDPTFHQAVMQEETDDQPENTIVEELQKGYTIHDRLLRPTMVVVSRAAAIDKDKEDPDPQQENS